MADSNKLSVLNRIAAAYRHLSGGGNPDETPEEKAERERNELAAKGGDEVFPSPKRTLDNDALPPANKAPTGDDLSSAGKPLKKPSRGY